MGEFNLVEVACIVYDILDYADDNKEAIRKEIDEVEAQLLECEAAPFHGRTHEENEKIRVLQGVISQLESHLRGGNDGNH